MPWSFNCKLSFMDSLCWWAAITNLPPSLRLLYFHLQLNDASRHWVRASLYALNGAQNVLARLWDRHHALTARVPLPVLAALCLPLPHGSAEYLARLHVRANVGQIFPLL